MRNKLVSGAIGLVLVALLFFVFGTRNKNGNNIIPDFKIVKGLISEEKLDEAKKMIDEIAKKHSDSALLGKIYFDLADSYEKKGKLVKARDIYEIILNRYQNIDNILEAQERLGKLNIKILFSPVITDDDTGYTVQPGDTLSKIAKKFGTTVELIKISNSLKGDIIRAHSKLKVPRAGYEILVDKSQNILTVLTDRGTVFKVYKVSTGENNSTPVGVFKITNKIEDPVWYTQAAVVPSESPDNILGSRWLGFSKRGYGIHGTAEPESVGRQATKGCIRMLNSEVEELYVIIPVATKVTITD